MAISNSPATYGAIPAATVAEADIRAYLKNYREANDSFPAYETLKARFPAGNTRLLRIRRAVEAELHLAPVRRRRPEPVDLPPPLEVRLGKLAAQLEQRLDKLIKSLDALKIGALHGKLETVQASQRSVLELLRPKRPQPGATAAPAAKAPPLVGELLPRGTVEVMSPSPTTLQPLLDAVHQAQSTTASMAQLVGQAKSEATAQANHTDARLDRLENAVQVLTEAIRSAQESPAVAEPATPAADPEAIAAAVAATLLPAQRQETDRLGRSLGRRLIRLAEGQSAATAQSARDEALLRRLLAQALSRPPQIEPSSIAAIAAAVTGAQRRSTDAIVRRLQASPRPVVRSPSRAGGKPSRASGRAPR